MNKDEALKLALESLEHMLEDAKQERLTVEYWNECVDAITAIKQALAAPVQEPVAWMYWQSCLNDDGTQTAPWVQRYSKFKPPESVINREITPLYTTPTAQRTWVGLTNKDVYECEPKTDWYDSVEFAQAIEARLKELNA